MTREEAAARLRALADSLAKHNSVEFSREGGRVTVAVPDEVQPQGRGRARRRQRDRDRAHLVAASTGAHRDSTSRSRAANSSGLPVWPYSPPRNPLWPPGNTTGSTPELRARRRTPARPAISPSVGAARLLPDADDHGRRRVPDRVEVRDAGAALAAHVGHEAVVAGAVVLGGQAEHRRVRDRLVARPLAAVHHQADEAGHPGADARRRRRPPPGRRTPGRWRAPSGSSGGHRRLVRHQDAYVVGVRGDQEEGVDGGAGRGEQVDRTDAQGLDEGVQVLGVLLGRHRRRVVVARAAPGVARVGQDEHAAVEPGRAGCRTRCCPSASRPGPAVGCRGSRRRGRRRRRRTGRRRGRATVPGRAGGIGHGRHHRTGRGSSATPPSLPA